MSILEEYLGSENLLFLQELQETFVNASLIDIFVVCLAAIPTVIVAFYLYKTAICRAFLDAKLRFYKENSEIDVKYFSYEEWVRLSKSGSNYINDVVYSERFGDKEVINTDSLAYSIKRDFKYVRIKNIIWALIFIFTIVWLFFLIRKDIFIELLNWFGGK